MARVRTDPVALATCVRDHALDMIKRHRRHCGQCNTALSADMPSRCCEVGWAICKYERMTAREQKQAEQRDSELASMQPALF